jgi:hypothetical protein
MYVLYKENKIPQIGGVHPKDLEILANIDDWYLTECPDDKLHKYEEFGFIPVPNKDIVKGLIILDSLTDLDFEDETMSEITISENDKKLAELAREFIDKINKKIKVRAEIRSIKDMEDDLVDVKRMLYFLIDFIIDDFNAKSVEEKNKSKYNNIINKLKEIRNNTNIIEIEANLKKIEDYIKNEIEISEIVLDKYLNQGE